MLDYTIKWNDDSLKNVKIYTVTAEGKGAYSSDSKQTQTFEITKATLTITANNKLIKPGAAPAHNGVTYSGFVGGETDSVLTGNLAYSYN